MFDEYLEKLRSTGKRSFTSHDVIKDLNIHSDAARAGLYRMKKNGKLISPMSGLYVIVPSEHKLYGSIPAKELISIMMKHMHADYYVGLLSAAEFYGAAHQKPMVFQVVTDRRIKHSLKFGQVHIKLIYKKSLENLPRKDFVVSSGYLKVATPELIAIDLLKFPEYAGGLNNIATVLSELMESIDINKLIELAENLNECYQLQRIGYMIERIEVMNDDIKNTMLATLEAYVASHAKYYTPLGLSLPRVGYSRCRKWKIIENTDFESD